MGDEAEYAESESWSLAEVSQAPRGGLHSDPYSVMYPMISVPRGGIQFPTEEKRQRMRTNDELLSEAENLRLQAERLEAIAEQRGRYGADPFKNGTVLKVDMKYRTGNRSYAYAVIKVGGKFYLSGRMAGDQATGSSAGYTWDNFVAWLAQGDATVWQATGLRQVL